MSTLRIIGKVHQHIKLVLFITYIFKGYKTVLTLFKTSNKNFDKILNNFHVTDDLFCRLNHLLTKPHIERMVVRKY